MKNLLKNAFGILCLAALLFVVQSCKRRNEVCSTCKALPQDGEANIKVLSSDYLVKYWETIIGPNRIYRAGIGEGGSQNVNEMIDWLGLPKETSSVSIVFYTNKFLANNEQLSKENILGCQYYYVVEGSLFHKFYYADKGKMVIVRSLTGESNGINYNNRLDIYNMYFSEIFENVLAFEITDKSISYLDSKHNEVSSAIKYMTRASQKYNTAKVTMPPSSCAKPCSPANLECQTQGHMPPSCDRRHGPTDDPSVEMSYNAVASGNLTQEDADVTFNLPLQYLFRDSFMNNYNYGQKYIGYYYELTVSNYLTPSIIQQSIVVLNLFNSRMNWLLSPSVYGNQILINNQFKVEATALIDLMIAAAPNNIEANHLIEAKNDLTTYENLTVNQFLSQIN